MADRFEKLYEQGKRLYKTESPVVIEAGALLKDTVSEEILIQLNFHSVSDKKIKALKVIISVFDVMGNKKESKVEYQYLDLQISNGDYFGSKKAIMLSDKSIRSFEIESYSVVFDDDSIWESGELDDIKEMPIPKHLSEFFGDAEQIEQYSIETTRFAKNIPEQYEELWCCTCGELNRTELCTKCNVHKGLVFEKLDKEAIIHSLESRLAREKNERAQKAEEERRKAEEIEKAKIIKQKQIKKYGIIAGIIVVIILILSIVISSVNTNKSIAQIEKYIEGKQYEHAFDIISTKRIGYSNRSKYIDEIIAGMREQFNRIKSDGEELNVDGIKVYADFNEIYIYDEKDEKKLLYKTTETDAVYENVRGVQVWYEGDRKWMPSYFMYSNGWIYFYEITDVFKSGKLDYNYTYAQRVNMESGEYETLDRNINTMEFYKLSDGRILFDDYSDSVYDPYKNKLEKNADISESDKDFCIYTTDK